MKIEHYTPSAYLKPFIKTFIFIESEDEIENFVLPDACMVMAFRYSGEVAIKENSTVNTLPPVVLSGIRHTPRYIHYSKQAANLLVVFQPNGASVFFNEPLHELLGISVQASFLKGYITIDEVLERLAAIDSKKGKIDYLEEVLYSKLATHKPDILLEAAIRKIQLAKGTSTIKQLIGELAISRDAFEKRFRKNVGTSPKHFSSIIKLKNAINIHSPNKTLTETAFEAGYYDQAHFIRDFKTYTGKTPSLFFGNPLYW